jgi:serine/threonine protein kinase
MHELEGDHDVRISYPWSPPEMLDGRSNGSVASDVYSLGATIWQLLVGRSPFSIPGGDNSTRALSARILHATPPATRRPDVPPALDALLQQCLAKEPSHRPQSAIELARGLQRVEATAGFPRTPISVETDAITTPVRDFGTENDPDATRLKPTVVSGSAPPTVPPGSARPTDGRGRAAAVVWAVVGTMILAGVGVLLLPNLGGDGGAPGDQPSSSVPSTPASLEPGLPDEPPVLAGSRTGDQVRVTWRAADGGQPGDTWQWRRTDTGMGDRTTADAVTLTAKGRVCVQVRLIRGQAQSSWYDVCVA